MPLRSPAALARPAALAGLAALALALAACQDPSGVGIGLLGESGGVPTGLVVAADSVRIATGEEPVLGGYGDGTSGLRPQPRVLVGHVEDPLVGTASATAYLDIRPPASIPSGFRERAITSVTLRLLRDFVYGDSTAELSLELRAVSAEWDPLDLAPDTALATGELIASFTVTASDTLVELALPAAWVAANTDLLRDEDVASEFHGFRLSLAEGASPGAVIGFRTSTQSAITGLLRVETSQEEVDYPVAETFTALTWEGAPTAPADRALLRVGDDRVLAFTFDLDGLDTLAVAGGAVRIDLDRALLDADGFSRPLPSAVALYGIADNADSTRVLLTQAAIPPNAETLTFASGVLSSVIQRDLLGTRTFARFEVVMPTAPLGLYVLPVVLGPAPATPPEDRRPRLTLTVVPAGQ